MCMGDIEAKANGVEERDWRDLVIEDGLPPGWNSDDEGVGVLRRQSGGTGMPKIGTVMHGGQKHPIHAAARTDVVVGLDLDTGKTGFVDRDVDSASSQVVHFLDLPSVSARQIAKIDRASTVGEPDDVARRRPRSKVGHTYQTIR